MPRLPAKQREAEKISTKLPGGSYAAAVHDAPSRHAFEEHATCLLSSLSGDRRKRKQGLEAVIDALVSKREEFRKEKKTGAGSATEAIEFYEYVLEKNLTWKGKVGVKKSKSSTSNVIGEDVEESSNQNLKEEECDFCEVCRENGELICCTTCDLLFHKNCIRPVIKTSIPNDWSCAHCDSMGITGLKKDSRQRKRAAIAVREMAKMKANSSSSSSSRNKNAKDGSMEDHVDDNKLGRDLSPKRQRRQTSLFNIVQKGGGDAKDSKHEEGDDAQDTNDDGEAGQPDAICTDFPVISREDIPPEILKKLSPKGLNSNSKHGQFHCKFCADNESFETCCFCACRVCFSKRDRTSTILCDICDAEYHIGCLSPPLRNIPKDEWFCPTCVTVITNAQTDGGGVTSNTSKKTKKSSKVSKGKGGAKKNAKSTKVQVTKKGATKAKIKLTKVDRNLLKADFASKQPRLACGRFAPKADDNVPVKRGRGRPPKSATSTNITTKPPKTPKAPTPVKKTQGTGRKRGRPPSLSKAKNITNPTSTPDKVKRRPGRPPKKAKVIEEEDTDLIVTQSDAKSEENSSVNDSVSDSQAQRSRSGRVLKRNKVYDVEEVHSQFKTALRQSIETAKDFPKLEEMKDTEQTISADEIKNATAAAIEAVASLSSKQQSSSDQKVSVAVEVVKEVPLPVTKQESSSAQSVHYDEVNNVAQLSSTSNTKAPTEVLNNEQQIITQNLKNAEQQNLVASFPVAFSAIPSTEKTVTSGSKAPRRKPGARECMQISRRFGTNIIPQQYMDTLLDYCTRGKVEHLIRMRERLDEHSRFLEMQLAGLEMKIEAKGGIEPVVGLPVVGTGTALVGSSVTSTSSTLKTNHPDAGTVKAAKTT